MHTLHRRYFGTVRAYGKNIYTRKDNLINIMAHMEQSVEYECITCHAKFKTAEDAKEHMHDRHGAK